MRAFREQDETRTRQRLGDEQAPDCRCARVEVAREDQRGDIGRYVDVGLVGKRHHANGTAELDVFLEHRLPVGPRVSAGVGLDDHVRGRGHGIIRTDHRHVHQHGPALGRRPARSHQLRTLHLAEDRPRRGAAVGEDGRENRRQRPDADLPGLEPEDRRGEVRFGHHEVALGPVCVLKGRLDRTLVEERHRLVDHRPNVVGVAAPCVRFAERRELLGSDVGVAHALFDPALSGQ